MCVCVCVCGCVWRGEDIPEISECVEITLELFSLYQFVLSGLRPLN